MVLKAFSIRDEKAGIFHPPFYKHSHGEAERDFTQLVMDEKSMAAKFPEDFDLWYLGEFNDQSGRFEPLETPQHVIKAVQITHRLSTQGGAITRLQSAPERNSATQ